MCRNRADPEITVRPCLLFRELAGLRGGGSAFLDGILRKMVVRSRSSWPLLRSSSRAEFVFLNFSLPFLVLAFLFILTGIRIQRTKIKFVSGTWADPCNYAPQNTRSRQRRTHHKLTWMHKNSF